MKQTTSIVIATLIATTVLMSTSTVFAQEWRVLLGQGMLQENQISDVMDKKSLNLNDWLATQTPLLKNTPITSVDRDLKPVDGTAFDSEYSKAGSWAPLTSPTGNDNFTLFSF